MLISASLVKELRLKTGVGMMDCKKALVASDGNLEKAVDWLKTKGLANATKKSGRVTAQGAVALQIMDKNSVAIEVNSETDFVAKNPKFQEMVSEIANLALNAQDLDSLKNIKTSTGQSVSSKILDNISTIGENLNLRRMQKLSINGNGVIASYVHNGISANIGQIAVLVALQSDAEKSKLTEFGKQIAMHIAAARPECLDRDSLDPKLIEREKAIFIKQYEDSRKPENIIQKMVEGRMQKFLKEIVLLDQIFVVDGKIKISEAIANFEKQESTSVKISGYIRYELGDGIAQAKSNFARDVADIAKS